MKKLLTSLTLLIVANVGQAETITLEIQIPSLSVAEYHRPYVAAWIENEQGQFIANLSVWYDQKLRNNEGETWLKDMRQWWRKSGRSLSFPVEGVTGATRPVGTHSINFATENEPFSTLSPGNYQLRIEAAREVGGREMVTLPFSWPLEASTTLQRTGDSELGTVSLRLSP